MKQLISKLDQFFYKYRKLLKLIDHEVNMKSVVKSVFGALILSLLVLVLPVLIIVNMFIISKLTLFLAILLVLLVMAWPFLYYDVYYKLLKNYHLRVQDINTKIPYWTESTIISIVLLIIGIIVLSVIF